MKEGTLVIKKIGIFIMLIAIVIGGYAIWSKPSLINTHAKVVRDINNLKELENQSPIILIANKNSEEVIIDKDINGLLNYSFTLSDFTVNEIIKNESSKEISIDKEIKVLENSAFDESENTIYTTNGYQIMEIDESYILFLFPNRTESEKFNNTYNIIGVTDGKFPVKKDHEKREKLFAKDIKNLEKENAKLNRELFEEVMKKYPKYYK